MLILLALFLSVDLGGDFGSARVEGRPLTAETIELTLEVEAETGVTMIAHLIEPGEGQETAPLAERSDGLYRLSTEARKVNYVVVFELIKPGLSRQSQPLLLTDLGLDPSVLGIDTSPALPEADRTQLWGWAGLGLGALALLGLTIWRFLPPKGGVPAEPGRGDSPQREKSP